METMLLLLSSFNLIMITLSSSPVPIMGMILLLCVITCFATTWIMMTPWFSFILFIIFVGALMVLFSYITSLASNETMTPPRHTSSLILILVVSVYILFTHQKLNFTQPPKISSSLILEKIFSSSIAPLNLSTMTFLLVTLIVCASISSFNKGPLRSKIFFK
uniref:NADH dehydrogenase subunit 6 n=1 Tax=Neelus murinus TaxID=1348065 RepID=A0A6B9IQ61_9HEXA|nr:NADH dehydrogenase subunit 6 [Neelus murinus]